MPIDLRPLNLGNPVSDHPLNRGLVSWWLPLPGRSGSTTLFDIVGTNHGTLTNGPTWVGGRNGFGALSFDGVNDYVDCGDMTGIEGLSQLTVQVYLRQATINSVGGLFTKSASGADIDLLNWSDTTNMFARIGGDSDYSISSGNLLTAGVDQLWGFVFDGTAGSGSKLKIYRNGVECSLGTNQCTATTVPANAINANIGKYTYSGQLVAGTVYAVTAHSLALTAAGMGAYYDQSLRGYPDLLRRASTRAWFVGAGAAASGITGTGSVTFDALTGAGAGALPIAGAGSASLGVLTGVAAGAVTVVGSGAVTLDALASTATGVVTVAGTGSVTLGDLTGSSGGVLPLVAAGGVTLGAMTSTAAGTLAITGSGSVTLGELTGYGSDATGGVNELLLFLVF